MYEKPPPLPDFLKAQSALSVPYWSYFLPALPNSGPTRARKSPLLFQRALNAAVLKVVMHALPLREIDHSSQSWPPAEPREFCPQ